MGKGGDARGRRKRPFQDEADWRRGGEPLFWDKGGCFGKGGRGPPPPPLLNSGARVPGPRFDGPRLGAPQAKGCGGKGQRRPQDRQVGGKGRGRKKGERKETEEEVEVEEEDEGGFAAQPWKLLDKEAPPKEEEPKEEEEEEEEDFQDDPMPPVEATPEAPAMQEKPVEAKPASGGAGPQGKPASRGAAEPAQEGLGERPRKRRKEEGPDLYVQLSYVPTEYTHSTLLELHESLGLDSSSLETSNFLDPGVGDEEHTCKVNLRYTSKDSAVEAASKLGSFRVTTTDGASRCLLAGLRSSEGRTTINPQVYISDLPAEFTEEALRDLHIAAGLPEDALVSSKFLPVKDPSADAKFCIARYQDDQLAEKAIEALRGKRVWASSGEYKDLGARMAKPVKWMDSQADGKGEGKRNAKRPRQEQPEASRELLDFAKRWGLDADTVDFLARLPQEVQTVVVDSFNPQDGAGNLMIKLRAFAREVQADLDQRAAGPRLDPGVKHAGMVKVWFEERGFGFIAPEMEGPDVYVHRSVLVDGSYVTPESKVTFTATWDVTKGKYLAQECWGAQGERQEPPVQPSNELRAFAERWSLDRGAIGVLARLPEEVQNSVMEQFQPEDDDSASGDNLFVSGLPVGVREELLQRIFGEHGAVVKCRLLSNRSGRQTDSAALVQMADPEQAEVAIERLHQATPEGCDVPLTVKFAVSNADKSKGKGKGKAKGKQPANNSKAVVLLARSLQGKLEGPSGAEGLARDAKDATEGQAGLTTSSSSTGPMTEIPAGVTLPGTVKFWNEAKGYGFVNPEGGGPDVFVHRRQLQDGIRLLREAGVTFQAEWDEDGWRYRATEVAGATDAEPDPPPERPPPPPSARASGAARAGGRAAGPPAAQYQGLVKAWFEERGFGFIGSEFGGADIYVHRNKLVDGSFLVPETLAFYNTHWDPAKGQQVVKECWGAYGERQEPLVQSSSELRKFAECWSLDDDSVIMMARLPEEMQLQIMADYHPKVEEPEALVGDDGSSLFVSGLPLDATDELVSMIFSEHGVVEKCKVLTNRNSIRQADRAALVQMADANMAENAIASLNQGNVVPEGCEAPLAVRLASRREDHRGRAKGKGKAGVVNHSKAVVMLVRAMQAKMDAAPPSGEVGGSEAPPAPSSSSTAEASREIQCGVMLPGIVKFWNEGKGYGFMNPEGGGPDVFVHKRMLKDGSRLHRNAPVTFIAEWDEETWRFRASEVIGATDKPDIPERPPPPPEQRPQGGKGKATGGARGSLPPPPPPSVAADGRPSWLHVPPSLPPHKQALMEQHRQKRQQSQQAVYEDLEAPPGNWTEETRLPEAPPPPAWPEDVWGMPAPPPAPEHGPGSKVLTPTAKVRPSSSAAFRRQAEEEAEAYPSSAPPYEEDPVEYVGEDNEWAAGVDEHEAIGDEQWSEQQWWGEGEQWPAEAAGAEQPAAGGEGGVAWW